MSMKLLKFTAKEQQVFEVVVQVDDEKKQFDVSIIDQDGVFGVQVPGEMEYLFHRSAKQSQKLIAEFKKKYISHKETSELQAA